MFCWERVTTCSLSSDSPPLPVNWISASNSRGSSMQSPGCCRCPRFTTKKQWRTGEETCVSQFLKIFVRLWYFICKEDQEKRDMALSECVTLTYLSGNLSCMSLRMNSSPKNEKWSTHPRAEDKVRWKFLVHFWSVTAKQHCSILHPVHSEQLK